MPRARILLRRLLITCAAGALITAAFLAVLRVPAVQTWLANRIVASQPGRAIEAERIDIGPGGLDALGINFAMPGLTAKSDPISVRLKPSRLIGRGAVPCRRAWRSPDAGSTSGWSCSLATKPA